MLDTRPTTVYLANPDDPSRKLKFGFWSDTSLHLFPDHCFVDNCRRRDEVWPDVDKEICPRQQHFNSLVVNKWFLWYIVTPSQTIKLHEPRKEMFAKWSGTMINEDDKYKLIETSSMSGPFSGPPSLSQERIHGVTANLSPIYPRHGNLQRLQ